jgi:hypothetical protein
MSKEYERYQGVDSKSTIAGKLCGKAATSHNMGLAQAVHYLVWRNFCQKEKLILSRASVWKPRLPQAPGRYK